MAASLLGGATSLISTNSAYAQAGTGELRGVIKDSKTGEAIIGATVIVSSPSLQGEQILITEDGGTYFATALPPGMYRLKVVYLGITIQRDNIIIQLGKEAVVNVPFTTTAEKGETIVVKGRAPTVDQGSTKTGVSYNKEYTNNLAVGRTFGAVVGATAGAQGDAYGTSVSGATSAENVYIVEGINTTDTGFGTQSSNLPNMFIGETEIITGGYNAEYGRATGGIINVTTKQGSNEFHGSVEGVFAPGALAGASRRVLREGASIDSENNRNYNWDIGAEIGGPIIKDKLWFHVGFNPSFTKSTTKRIVNRSVDVNDDGKADIDGDTGFSVREQVATNSYKNTSQTAYFTAKINGAVSSKHQFQISGWGNPDTATGVYSLLHDPNTAIDTNKSGAYDVSAKWTSKLNDGKTQIDFVAGYHNGFAKETPASGQDVETVRYEYQRSLYDFAAYESGIDGCNDNDPMDPYKKIRNCGVSNYSTGGPGFLEDRKNNRTSVVLSATQRVKALGTHVFKAGLDAELSTYNSGRKYSGGAFIIGNLDPAVASDLAGAPAPESFLIREYLKYDKSGDVPCGQDQKSMCSVTTGLNADTQNRSIGAYLQDSWQIRPNFTLNAGLRWEQQVGYTAKYLQGTIASDTGETIPKEAFKFNDLLAPRLGFIFDPTNEGRAKIFGHWGRFYESVPLDINVRAFGGETTNERTVGVDGDETPDMSCPFDTTTDDLATKVRGCTTGVAQSLGGAISYFAPGTKGQYSQELILGTEYELLSNFKMGVNYIHRTLPRIIEDMSTDSANNYFIGNPGEDYTAEANKLTAQAMALAADDPLRALYLQRASWLNATKGFDKPSRNYDAIQISATQRPTAKSLLIASYTYSKSRGNYPGLFSTETNQLDPNLTSMYDIPDLMANRYGANGLDRPHLFKVDGTYALGPVLVGMSFRAQSGLPHNTLGAHPVYGQGESFLLQRGALERSPMTYQVDTHIAVGHNLSKFRRIEAFVDIFNLFNSQKTETDVDDIYTIDSANPVVGGDLTDLAHAKVAARPRRSAAVITPNKNYGNLTSHQAPISARLGVRITF